MPQQRFGSAALAATFLALQRCVVASECPLGIGPGEFYPHPQQVWKAGDSSSRCTSSPIEIVSYNPGSNDLSCASNDLYFVDRGFGGWWCGLAKNESSPGCRVELPVEDDQSCFEKTACFSEYGLPRCVQCPCASGHKGRDCNQCEPSNCDALCRKHILRPGVQATCDFGGESWYGGGFYTLMMPEKMGQPRLDVSVHGAADNFKVLVEMFYSMCTLKQQLIFAVNFTECEIGVKESCLARGIPTPCVVCDLADPVYIPDDSYLIGQLAEPLFRAMSTAGLLVGCEYSMCKYYIQAIPLDFGELRCDFGAMCLHNSSGAVDFGEVIYVDDASANKHYVLYLVLIVAAIFGFVGLVVAAAASYKFKAEPDPQPLESSVMSWRELGLNNIITNMGGEVSPGQFVAILGTVGAGKSTLLKVLAGRLRATTGDICINGEKVNESDLRRTVGFVPQDQICCARDTVAEAIGFAATMCGGSFPEIGVLAEKLPEKIGTLSGGQRRLVDIYVELARRPSVLLLDEPTTGLDSETALVLGKLLKEVSKQIPVVATIHQPRPEFAELFTDVMIFSSGKQVCTGGKSTGHDSAMDALVSICRAAARTQVYRSSVCDIAVELASDGVVLNSMKNGTHMRASQVLTGPSVTKTLRNSLTQAQQMARMRKTPMFIKQMVFLSIRNAKRGLRHGGFKYLVSGAISVLLGLSFFQVDSTIAGLRNRFSILFLVHAFFALQGISATGEMTEVFNLTEHEIASHVYGRRVDALVRVLSQFAGQLPHALILTVILYPMVGLRSEGGRPLIFMLCMMSSAVAAACIALLARGRTVGIGGVIAAAGLNGTLSFLCGAFTSTDEMAAPLKLLLKISPFRYSFEVVVAYELIGLQTQVEVRGQPVAISAGGEYYLESLSLPSGLGEDLFMRVRLTAIMALVWAFLAFLVLSLPAYLFSRQTGLQRSDLAGELSVGRLCNHLGSWNIEGVASTDPNENRAAAREAEPERPETSPAENPEHAADRRNGVVALTVGEQSKQVESLDPTVSEMCLDASAAKLKEGTVELMWSGLSNPDTKDLAGGVRTGQLLGIVGPCGSGKTTLLRMLCGRVQPEAGSVTINGQVVTSRQLRAIVGYVPQEEWMCGEDTVSEALAFAAGWGIEKKALSTRNSLITGSGLVDTAPDMQQLLGTLSQGQRRIAAVCAELARRPLAMMLDEPTSGLDTASSMRLTELLKGVSKRIPVIMTLHQPRVEMQHLLSHVLIMQRGKTAVFMRYDDLCKSILPFPTPPLGGASSSGVESVAGQVAETTQVCTKDVDVAEDDDAARELSQRPMFCNFPGAEHESQINQQIEMTTTALDLALKQLDTLGEGGHHLHAFTATAGLSPPKLERAKSSMLRLALSVTRRALRRTWQRKPRAVCGMVVTWGLAGLILGVSMQGQLNKTTEGIIARLGMMFVINSIVGILTLPYIYEFNTVRSNILHELESQVGSPFLYHCCHTFVACTERLPCALLFSLIVVRMTDINSDTGRCLTFLLLVFLVSVLCVLLAAALASMLKHTSAVNTYNGILVFMLVFGASFMAIDPNEEVPSGNQALDALQYGSFLSYAYEAQVANELVGLKNFTLVVAGMEVGSITGDEWLDDLNIPQFIGGNILILLCWAGALWTIGAIGLWRSTLPHKRAAKTAFRPSVAAWGRAALPATHS